MTWIQRFRVREYVRDSLWPVPLTCVVVAVLLGVVSWRFDRWAGWALLEFKPGGAVALLGALVGAMITFTGFVFTILLVAVQFASAQLTPRILKTSLTEPFTKFALGLFSGTAVYGLIVMSRVTDDFVPQTAMALCVGLLLLTMLTFPVFIHHMAKSLRPATIVAKVGRDGRRVLQELYPGPFVEAARETSPAGGGLPGPPTRTVRHTGASGVVLAVDVKGLVAEAGRGDAVLALVPAVGDFVSTGAPLFRVFEISGAVNDRRLRDSVAVGRERTLEQDPAFAFRILVDIAIKALSPAINDPTSAVMCLDQIQQLLAYLGACQLDAGRYGDGTGRVRLIVPLPEWDDYVKLSVVEIRQFGRESVQVARRLRAMLEDLLDGLPKEREAAVRQELDLTARTVERSFPEPEDRARAHMPDHQGSGVSRAAQPRSAT